MADDYERALQALLGDCRLVDGVEIDCFSVDSIVASLACKTATILFCLCPLHAAMADLKFGLFTQGKCMLLNIVAPSASVDVCSRVSVTLAPFLSCRVLRHLLRAK